ncbi:MAG: cytochrome c3 family protein [Desulfovibrionales bacterium]|nr:cytochrome c3 family protein [Desulfovibrionales bacterium]
MELKRHNVKILQIIIIYIAALIVVIPNLSHAKVTGVCYNCHTMHNSQGGASMAQEYSSGSGGLTGDSSPNPCLLSYDCVGCHFSSTANTIVSNTPVVLNSAAPASPLAGGNFYWAVNTGDKYGHNVYGIKAQEGSPMDAPPGFKASAGTPSGYGTGPASWATQLNCAGVYGCHGDRTQGTTADTVVEAMKGAHHADDSTIDGTSTGKSYRFLRGVNGVELNATGYKWEQTADSTHHNGYKGGATPSTTTDSISYLCGTCHGNFHGHTNLGSTTEVGSAWPWFRHPTDLAFTSVGGGYAGSEYASYTSYSTTAPVALSTPSTSTSTVDSASMVICLSCHRAHGSPNYKMIRWDYKSATLSTALSGCNVCHTSKN